MPVHNNDIADILTRLADLLDIEGSNQFRIRAYRDAARTISSLSKNATDMVNNREDLTALPGIGKDMAGKIKEIVQTGSLKQLEEAEKRVPPDLSKLMKLSELGPRRIKQLYQELGITTIEQLEKAAKDGKISSLKGFGQKSQKNILEEIGRLKQGEGAGRRFRLDFAEEIITPLVEYLKNVEGVNRVMPAGSYRRRRDTVGDMDILVTCTGGSRVMDRFVEYEDVERVLSRGETRSSVVLRHEFQVDVRVVPSESYGAALHYFTGSKAHNVAVRKLGVQRNLKINEYGVFRDDKRIAGKTEQEVFEQVELPFIEPELRENRGEVEAAQNNRLPNLVKLENIKGELHVHTKATDGRFTLEEMVNAARARGYRYLAVTDHSKRVSMAGGLDEKRLARQIEEIDRLNQNMENFHIIKAIEVDILEDGRLDLSDSILKELELVECAIHYNFKLPYEKQTARVLRALENPYVNILSHPTGRIIGKRPPYEIDIKRVIKACREKGCCLEINSQPDRLDLNDIHTKMAKEMGVKLAISTDAHTISNLDYIKYGLAQARRGWLECDDVLNTRDWEELEKLLKRK